MNSDFLRIPEPSGPETQLLRSAAPLPTLSPELRQRVLTGCSRQIVVGKAIRAGQQFATVAASVAGVAVLIWLFLPGTTPQTGRNTTADSPADSLLQAPGLPPGSSLSLPTPAPSLGNIAATDASPSTPLSPPKAPQAQPPQPPTPVQP
ncbi:MAG: hypothetical protein ACKOEO_20185 [Planctomycetaceae bacterium]